MSRIIGENNQYFNDEGLAEVRKLGELISNGRLNKGNVDDHIRILAAGNNRIELILRDYAEKIIIPDKSLSVPTSEHAEKDGAFAQRIKDKIGLDEILTIFETEEYSESLEIPKSFMEVLKRAVKAEAEIEYVMLVRRQGADYKPEALAITGLGSPGGVESDEGTLSLIEQYLNSDGNENVWFILGHTHSKGTYKIGAQYADGFSGTDRGDGYRSLDRQSMYLQRQEKHPMCLGFMLATWKPGDKTSVFFEPYKMPGQTQKIKEF